MTIANVAFEDVLTSDKINEIIDAINALASPSVWMTNNQDFTTASLANVTELVRSVAVSTVYDVHCRLFVGGDDVNGLATAWTYPNSATFANGQHSVEDTAAGGASTAANLNARGLALAASPSTTLFHRVPDTNLVMIILEGTLETAGTAGSLQLRASKHANTSGTATTLYAGSMLTVTKRG